MEPKSFSYSVFSFVKDELAGTAIPVGVAVWGRDSKFLRIRLAKQKERVRGLDSLAYFQIEGVRLQLEIWVKEGALPYSDNGCPSYSDEWWRQVSRLFVHQVKISEPRTIDCIRPDEEIESLFEAVVGPRTGEPERAKRIDSAISKSLGGLTRRLSRGSIQGYRGRAVNVRLSKANQYEVLVVEGVNLAAADAETQSDALVSRLLRIKAGNEAPSMHRTVRACIGYLASPHGLNGEAALVEWIKERGEAQIFDLIREPERFADAVHAGIDAIIPQRSLPA